MKKPFLLLMFFCFLPEVFAQQVLFSKAFNWHTDDQVRGIKQTTDGGYLLYGSRYETATNLEAAYIMKTNRQGDSIWIRRNYSPTAWTDARDLILLADGSMVVAGAKWSFVTNSWEGWLMKTDPAGNRLWETTFNGPNFDYLNSLSELPDGSFIISGMTESKGAGNRDAWLIKTDNAGNLLWENTFGGIHFDEVIRVKVAANGDFIMAGGTYSFSGNPGVTDDVYLIRTNPQGNMLWFRTFGTPNIDWANDLVETQAGDIVIAGLKNNQNTSLFSGQALFLKTDSNGNLLWDNSFTLNQLRNEIYRISLTPQGGFLLSGFTTDPQTIADAFVAKADSSGNILWNYKFGSANGQSLEMAYAHLQDDEGKVLMAGFKNPLIQDANDLFFIKLTDAGVLSEEEPEAENLIAVYPNPASSELTVLLPAPEKSEIRLTDLTGRTILTAVHEREASIKLNTGKVASGIYLLEIKSEKYRKLMRVEIIN